jgi:hypothetical protein
MAKESQPRFANFFTGAELRVIKRRARKDWYFYEIVRPNKSTLIWDPKISEEIGHYPDLEDTWHSGKLDGQMFDLNLMDSSVYGTATTALGACFYAVNGKGTTDDPYEPNMDEWVNVPVKCFLQDANGHREPFPCSRKSRTFLRRLGLANPNR